MPKRQASGAPQMGSVIIEAMAGGTLAFQPKKLHPFFTVPRSLQQDPDVATPAAPATAAKPPISLDTSEIPEAKNDMEAPEDDMRDRKRRKKAEDVDQDWDDAKRPRRGRKKANPQGTTIMNHFPRIHDEDPVETLKETAAARDETKNSDTPSLAVPIAEDDAITGVAPFEVSKSEPAHKKSEQNTPPKKMLLFNRKTGTIGSPPKPKGSEGLREQKHTEDTVDAKKKPTPKGMRRSARIARVKYGRDDASRERIGAQIDGILNGSVAPIARRKKRTSPRGIKPAQDTKPQENADTRKQETHPFFTEKSKKTTASTTSDSLKSEPVNLKPAPSPTTRPRIFTSTPISPKKTKSSGPNKPFPQFGLKSLGLKTPGARVPAWPWKDMVHVRGEDVSLTCSHPTSYTPLPARKSKGNTTYIPPEDIIIYQYTSKLRIPEAVDAVQNIDTDNFLPPPPELRLPQKHFESGLKLEKRILPEIKNLNHASLERLRGLLATSLSAFDKYQCESTSWAQKYCPASAVEVLQYGKEAFLLRDWLQALKVQSVHTGNGNAKSRRSPPPKKKRKKNKLDDFIVDSDEEANQMGEMSDPEEEDWSPDRRGGKKTVIRAGDTVAKDSKNAPRLTNTVVISGPHGCGKTSAVYAIARELDFEVFEINPGSRRSGKDVLEKIGDMTRNHLVQHQQVEGPAVEAAIDEDEIAQDIESGKQATMNTFFKPKAAPKPAEPKKKVRKEESTKSEQKKFASKHQKQSLILLDEVDILYEEDKQFWSTVVGLIAQSKRPFILTCNDENLVPLQTLNLHGIFRFSTPPTDLAVDRLLMIAACEGHALGRNAVQALFEARQQDLRACLMDLNYWCQIGVGDRRSGVDWYYPRWPKGVDIDNDGKVIRVVSQDTYTEGMGWLAHDVLKAEEADIQELEQELLRETWDFWQLDLGDWQDSLDLASWAKKVDTASSRQNRLSIMEKYDDFTNAMSAADLFSATEFASRHEEAIDCTLPDMTAKARDDFILGRQLLDAPVSSTYDPLAISLPNNLKCLARSDLRSSHPSPELYERTENSVISRVRQHASRSSIKPPISRDDFSLAFDPLAASEKATAGTSLDMSVFDGTLSCIALDVGPYVRGIVAYDNELQKQRLKKSNLLSRGGTKRMRNTRAAHAALEGGSRSSTRPDKWFKADLNGFLIMQTAGEGWAEALREETNADSDKSSEVSSRVRGSACRVLCDDDDSSDELGGSIVTSSADVDVD
ncbi:hypothetical protein SLS53_007556 [Cytospora paraplurivora]|uniref:AAA+ ATPase domain-containing protein n=1 Tax=Cytospora paraplurivora TaxID=2898453 RepID=A0AAN9U8W2_9PEZI